MKLHLPTGLRACILASIGNLAAFSSSIGASALVVGTLAAMSAQAWADDATEAAAEAAPASVISINFYETGDEQKISGTDMGGTLGGVGSDAYWNNFNEQQTNTSLTDSSGQTAGYLTSSSLSVGNTWVANSSQWPGRDTLDELLAYAYIKGEASSTWTLNIQTDFMFSSVVLYFVGNTQANNYKNGLININGANYTGSVNGATLASTEDTGWGVHSSLVSVNDGETSFVEGTNQMTYSGDSANFTGAYTISSVASGNSNILSYLAGLQVVDLTANYLWTATGTALNSNTMFSLTGKEDSAIAGMAEGTRYIGLSNGQTLSLSDSTQLDAVQGTTGRSTISGTNLTVGTLFAKQGATLTVSGTLASGSNVTLGGLGTLKLNIADTNAADTEESTKHFAGSIGILQVASGHLTLQANNLSATKMNTLGGANVSLTGGELTTQRLVLHDVQDGSTAELVSIQNSTVNVTGNGSAGTGAALLIGHWKDGSGQVSVLTGGELNVLSGATVISWNSAGTLLVNGGTANLTTVSLAKGIGDHQSKDAILKLQSGRLNIGSGGIVNANEDKKKIVLEGGTLGVIDSNWTVAAGAKVQVTGDVSVDTATSEGEGKTINILASLDGAGNISMINAGTLQISGSAATYSGTLTVEGGSVRAEAWNGTHAITLAGGAVTGNFSMGTVTGTGTLADFTLNGGTIDFGTISGTDYEPVLTSTGTLTLSSGHFVVAISESGLPTGDTVNIYTLLGSEGTLGDLNWENYTLNGNALAVHEQSGHTVLALGERNYEAYLSSSANNQGLTLSLSLLNTFTWNGGSGSWSSGAAGDGDTSYYDDMVVVFGANDSETTVTIEGEVRPSAIEVQADGSYTFTGGSIAGEAIMDLAGSATLASANADWAGVANVHEGASLTIGDANALGSSALHLFGGTLKQTDSMTLANHILQHADSAVDVASNKTMTLSGNIEGADGLAKTGAGSLVLSGDNSSFSGSFKIENGMLKASSANALGSASLSFNGGALAVDDGNAETTLSVTNRQAVNMQAAGSVEVGALDELTLSGVISGSGTLTKTGAGTLIISNTSNSLTGGIIIDNGTLKAGNSYGIFGERNNSSTASGGKTVTINSKGVFDINGHDELNYMYTLAGGALVNNGSNATNESLRNIENITLTQDSKIGGTGNFHILAGSWNNSYIYLESKTLTKEGSNTITLYSTQVSGGGTINITSGTLKLYRKEIGKSLVNFNGDTRLVIGAGGTFEVGYADNGEANINFISLAGAGALNLGTRQNKNFYINTKSEENHTFSGTISGTGKLYITGTGTQTLSGANTYSGGTTISGGTLTTTKSGALGNGVVTIQEGGKLNLTKGEGVATGGADISNAVHLNGGKVDMANASITGAVTLGNKADGTESTSIISGNDADIRSAISGTGNVKLQGNSGPLRVYSETSFTGDMELAAGTINLGDGAVGTANIHHDGDVNISGATVNVNTYHTTGTHIHNSGNINVRSGSLTINSGAQISSTVVAQKVDATEESGYANVATLAGKNGADATFSGVTVTNSGLSGGELSAATVTVDKAFALDGVRASDCAFTLNDALEIGEKGATLAANSSITFTEDGCQLTGEGALSLELDATASNTLVTVEVGEAKLATMSTSQLQGSLLVGNIVLDASTCEALTQIIAGNKNIQLVFTGLSLAETQQASYALMTLSEDTPAPYSGAEASGSTSLSVGGVNFSLGSTLAGAGYTFGDYELHDGSVTMTLNAIPEPATATLSLLALAALAARRRRR